MLKIAIVGSGVVGQATGKGFLAKEHQVVFIDINPEVVNKLKKEGYKACLPDELEKEEIDVFFLTVSTPTVDGKIELNFLKAAIANLGSGPIKKSNKYQLVVTRSTVPPGTSENLVVPLIEKYSGKKAGKDFGVCMNPEYLREHSSLEDFRKPWIVIIGSLDRRSGKILEKLYQPLDCPIHHVSLKDAEIQKYIHNLFNACKITFFNEMRLVCEDLKLNADKIFRLVAQSAEASWNPKYGTKNLGPFAGSCLPKDTTAFLSWSQNKLERKLSLLKTIIKVNEQIKEKNNN